MIRDMMVYHSRRFQDASVKVEQARAVLDFLVQSAPSTTPYGMILRQELDEIRHKPDTYLFHEHLEEVNEPLYFHQFIEAAERHGMQYLAEAEFAMMMVSNLPAEIATTLRRIAWDLTALEQYMDFVRNRTFRQTLLIHQGVTLNRNLDSQVMKSVNVTSLAQPVSAKPSVAPGVPESFRTEQGATLSTANPITKAAMLLLAKQSPPGLPFEQLVAASRTSLQENAAIIVDAATLAQDALLLGNDLLKCYAGGVVELRIWSPRLCLPPSERPTASPFARLQAERSEKVTNLRHESVLLHGFSRELLRLLDGTRDRDALAVALARRVQEGAFVVQQGGKPLTGGPALEKALRQSMDASLMKLANSALLLD
jgi:methyltransferase-like protein